MALTFLVDEHGHHLVTENGAHLIVDRATPPVQAPAPGGGRSRRRRARPPLLPLPEPAPRPPVVVFGSVVMAGSGGLTATIVGVPGPSRHNRDFWLLADL